MEPIFDSHFHIINPDYPLIENNNYFPPSYYYENYLNDTKNMNVKGGVVISGSYHGYNQSYLKNALKQLGENFFGVTQLPFNTSAEKIEELDKIGVRGIRFNIKNGLEGTNNQMLNLANKVYELAGWHVDVHISNSEIKHYQELLEKLPSVVIDHLGLETAGLDNLYHLVENGVKVKASGFGRGNLDIKDTLRNIYNINPNALMFGSDLPSTRAKNPFKLEDIHLIKEVLGKDGSKKILFENANLFYNKLN